MPPSGFRTRYPISKWYKIVYALERPLLMLSYDCQSASLSWCWAPIWDPWADFGFCLTLWVSWREAPSLTRGWVCNLLVQLLLSVARAVTVGSNSRRTHHNILQSHLRLPQPRGSGLRIHIPQEHGGPFISSGTGFPFRRLLRLARSHGAQPWWSVQNVVGINNNNNNIIIIIIIIIALQPFVQRWQFFQYLDPIQYTQSVWLLGRVISPPLVRNLRTGQHKQSRRTQGHPCSEWDSNPRSQCSNGEDCSCLRSRRHRDRLYGE
jgi:hypothetical protein